MTAELLCEKVMRDAEATGWLIDSVKWKNYIFCFPKHCRIPKLAVVKLKVSPKGLNPKLFSLATLTEYWVPLIRFLNLMCPTQSPG